MRRRNRSIEAVKELMPAAGFVAFGLTVVVLLGILMSKVNTLEEQVERLSQTADTPVTIVTTTTTEPEPEPTNVTEQMKATITTQATELTEAKPEQTPQPQRYTEKDVELIGRTIWGEAGGVQSKAERAAVAWCILNRVDAFEQSIEEVVTAPYQFQGYRPEGDCPEEHLDLAEDVLERWQMEKYGVEEVGRVLPADCLYFIGDGKRNHFTHEWQSTDYWGWELPDPYK